ncbi:MAG: MerR family transcriptional regulator [Pacificimonas sp.]
MAKSVDAFRTISEVSAEIGVAQHVLRFWETKFKDVAPVKRGGGRRYYRPSDVALLAAINHLLHVDGLTIKGVQKLLKEQGAVAVAAGASVESASVSNADIPVASGGVRPNIDVAELKALRDRLVAAVAAAKL